MLVFNIFMNTPRGRENGGSIDLRAGVTEREIYRLTRMGNAFDEWVKEMGRKWDGKVRFDFQRMEIEYFMEPAIKPGETRDTNYHVCTRAHGCFETMDGPDCKDCVYYQ